MNFKIEKIWRILKFVRCADVRCKANTHHLKKNVGRPLPNIQSWYLMNLFYNLPYFLRVTFRENPRSIDFIVSQSAFLRTKTVF